MTGAGSDAAAAVRDRYDELASIIAWWRAVPARARLDDDHDAARRLLAAEARLLDDGRDDDWLAGWSPSGLLWVPLDPDRHPGEDQSYFLDDMRRLRERLRWRHRSSAWSQWPAPRTVRSVTNVESARDEHGGLRVRSVLTIHAMRSTEHQVWCGHQIHALSDADSDGRRSIRLKVVVVPALAGAVPHPGVIL
jgi:3-phenylpropionate/cinnamic acid dioxygenase small subunit